ncbi:PLP-dependent aminotransferase family protein [Paenibacillus sp. YPG26]|uniref:aminotransferase-like domain-containing protein n=1 Tax=Paenibacillus sp. YPG26 TaxID=2878915 RepID=UPI00203A94E4|nr:PLP-dependent aminotransferase family protein [Paenibacillus sp. YPG26]USB33793.1 PLP-dependent aminotransferase family protein [Paenibacillus sp. YPG26]
MNKPNSVNEELIHNGIEHVSVNGKSDIHVQSDRGLGGTHPQQRLFQQVYDLLLEKLAGREWGEHEKLPSVRTLAAKLGVHRLTVLKAYQLLRETGHVYVKEKSGYYVLPEKQREDHTSTNVGNYLPESGDCWPVRLHSFSQALVDPALLPNRYFSEYAKKVFDLYPKVLSTYSSVQGDEELRSVLCRLFAKTHQLHLTADDLLITTGAQQAIDLIARAFVQRGDVVLIERPTYHAAITIFEGYGARLVPVDISPDGYDLVQLEKLMRQHQPRMFYINPTFHNPTGYTVPVRQRKLLAELAERYHCLIAEDDSFRDIYFNEAPPPPVASYDTDGWVLYIRSFSKYAAPGLRVAAVCAQPPRMNLLLQYKYQMDNGAPLLNQKVFLLYLASERLTGHLEKLRIALELRKVAMEETLREAGWTWESPDGGLSLWVQLPEGGVSAEILLERCAQHGVSFSPGIAHDPLREMRSYIRLSYSFVNEAEIKTGMRRLIESANPSHSPQAAVVIERRV